MTIRIFAIGDVMGRPGRRVLRETLPELKEQLAIDCVIANVENAAGGFGITHKVYSELLRYGVDLMSSGNHLFDKPETETWIDSTDRLVRPLNFLPEDPGPTSVTFEAKGKTIRLLTLMGRVFMKPYDCPFRAMNTWLENRPSNEIVLVDMHAEATSEKQAMGWHLSQRVSAVWGTHTHVPTADARILDSHTGFLTDLGMTGPYNSVIGMRKESVLPGFLTLKKNRFEVAKDDLKLSGCLFDIDADTTQCTRVQPFHRSLDDILKEIEGQ